jgi:hypothetical protein
MSTQTNFSSWWGRHAVEVGRSDFWQIGPLSLWIQHLPNQWRMHTLPGRDWLESQLRMVPGASAELAPAEAFLTTCMFRESRDDLLFSPVLPDRPSITQLKTPIHILPGEEVSLFVVTPLWLRIEMVEPVKTLLEVPTYRMSDTWFGPPSIAGELCYATPGEAYLQIREVPLRLHCTITAVLVKNLGTKSLRVDRLNVPLPRLSLFYSARTGFWTDSLTLETKGEDAGMASMKLHHQPPADVAPTQFVTGPRQSSPDPTSMIRAFSALFRERS